MIFVVLKRLFAVFFLAALGMLVARLLGKDRRARQGRPDATTPRVEGSMVRDRVCNTFLPRSRALSVKQADETHFFCSETCRDSFLERRASRRPATAGPA